MQITLNGGPFDGKIIEVESGDHPHLYCGWMGDGYIRVYNKQSDSEYIYSKTVRTDKIEGDDNEL